MPYAGTRRPGGWRYTSSERSAERRIRILNAAIDHGVGVGKGTSLVVSLLLSVNSFEDLVYRVPHGMRGRSCYLTIGVLAKRTSRTRTAGPMGKSQPIISSAVHSPIEKLPSCERFSLQVRGVRWADGGNRVGVISVGAGSVERSGAGGYY